MVTTGHSNMQVKDHDGAARYAFQAGLSRASHMQGGLGLAQPVAPRGRRVNADAMRLFRKAPGPGPRRPRLQPRVPRRWDPPQTEFPGIVPVNTLQFDRSEQAAVAITGIAAYSTGFEFAVTRLLRPGAPGFDAELPTPRGMVLAYESFQISLQLSDGRKVSSERPHGDAEPAGPILRLRGGGGTSHYQLTQWWVWPLPPRGPLEFICQWPALGTGETRVGIDAQLILDAARRSVQLWPPDKEQ